MSTRDKVQQIFCNVMEISNDNLPAEVTPDTVESWDSVRHLNLVLALEDEFEIEFDEDDMHNILSLDEFVKYVEKELG